MKPRHFFWIPAVNFLCPHQTVCPGCCVLNDTTKGTPSLTGNAKIYNVFKAFSFYELKFWFDPNFNLGENNA